MRDIKFRAWDCYKKEMVKVLGLNFNVPLNVKGLSGIAFEDSDGEIRRATHHGVADFKLMQYTGLTDKNGTEIYEGDILKRHDKFVDAVKFEKSAFRCFGKAILGTEINVKYCEVIGNTYENPDLLES